MSDQREKSDDLQTCHCTVATLGQSAGCQVMEITEKWIGECAGGRVFKDARALVRLGKVQKVKRSEDDAGLVFQGVVGSGRKPMRVVVRVLGPTQVKNLCSCSVSRATGAMCEHAAAVLLAAVMGVDEVKSKSGGDVSVSRRSEMRGGDVLPLAVRLSPRFPYQDGRAVHLRRVEGVEVGESDRVLAEWLMKTVGGVDAAMLSLPEDKVVDFYRVLSGHPRVSRDGVGVSVVSGVVRPRLELELDEESEGAMMWMKLADVEDGVDEEVVLLGGGLVSWDAVKGRLVVPGNNVGAGVVSEELAAGDWWQVETGEFVRGVSVLSREYQLPDDLGGLEVREAVPGIGLEIAGSTRALQVRMTAVYFGGVCVPLASASGAKVAFPIPSDEPRCWLMRNPDAEKAAVARLMESGFQVLDASGALFLRGEDEVIDFLTTRLPVLREVWDVKTDEKLLRLEGRLDRIVPRIELQGGGADWLACDVSWQVGGEVLSRDAVRRLLQGGGRTVALPGGGKAVVSRFDAEVMEGFLLDTDPRQEGGHFYLPAAQEAYVKRLRGYYEGGGGAEDGVSSLPEGLGELEGVLRDYQREGVGWLYQRAMGEGAALLADDMGLGKTLQTLAFLKLWKQKHPLAPALVVCPATLLGSWRDEAAKFVPGMNVLVMHGARRKDYYEVMSAADIIVTSYALLERDLGYYQRIELGVMVLDEASAIRNPDTLVAKAARKVQAATRIAITGTPVENSVRDLWSVFQFLLPGYLGGREDFRRRYELPCAAEVPDRAAMQRLRWRTEPFMLRRTKQEVAKDLPPKIESVVWCDPSPLQREHYEGILRYGAEKVDELRRKSGAEGARMQVLSVLLRLRQSCCDLRLLGEGLEKKSLADISVKLARLMELLDEAGRGGHRVLVFSQFTSMLSLIRDELEREDIGYSYLDGATRDRSAVVDRFQKPDGPPVFLISLKAGGYGLTLTAADTVVLFDPWWNPAVEAQAADRVHRIGQTKPTTIYKLITRGTVEEKILRLQERKRSVITAAMGEVGDEVRPMMSGLSEGEMLELLG